MGGLRCRNRALDPRPLDGRFEHLALRVGHRLHAPVLDEVADDGRVAVIAEAAGVDGRGHEVVAQRVHGQQGRHAGGVAEVVLEAPARERRARRRLDGDEANVGVWHERQRDPRQVRAPTAAGDDDVGPLLAGHGKLLLGLEPDHCLVEQDVVEHGAERVVGVVARGGVAHGVADGGAQRTRVVGIVDRRGDDVAAPGLDHHPSVRLLLVRGPHHVDLAFEIEEVAREGQRAPPLTGACLRAQPGDTFLFVVEGRRCTERLFHAAGADQGRGPPEAKDVGDGTGDVDPRLCGDLLADERHREQGRQVVGADRFAGCRMEGRIERSRQTRQHVEPGLGQAVGRKRPAHQRAPFSIRTAAAGSAAVTNDSPTSTAS